MIKLFLILIALLGCNTWDYKDFSDMPSLYTAYVKGSCVQHECKWNRFLTNEELEWLDNEGYQVRNNY